MTTATLTNKETPASTETGSPTDSEMASLFYGSEKEKSADTRKTPSGAPAETETGSAATSEKTPAASTDPVKGSESAKGAAESKESKESKETKGESKGDEGGHRAAAARLGNEVKDLAAKLNDVVEENKVLKAKIEGTYKEPEKPTAKQIEDQAEFVGRERASRIEADRVHGAAVVKENIYDKDSPYEKLVKAKPWIQHQIIVHPQPTVEAMRVLAQETFYATYGEDPTQWVSKIEAELKPKLLEELKQQTQKPPTGQDPPSVTESRGSGGPSKERSIVDVFYGKS
jgi:hypothetical protein